MTAALLFTACGATACGAPATDEDSVTSEAAALKSAARKILPAAAQPIYFGTMGDASLDATNSLAQRFFTANAGVAFTAAVVNPADGGLPGAGAQAGFKLQRAVKQRGTYQWAVVGQADSAQGRPSVTYMPPRGSGIGLYLITATSSPLPAQLHLNLSCQGRGCATALQPGEPCGGIIGGRYTCGEGTYCAYSIAEQCGSGDQQGICTISPNFCPHGIRYNPICGCDGKTYDGACNAAAGGTSMQRVGGCENNVTGNWSYVQEQHYDYTFNPDGTFTSAALPPCLFTTPPTCAIRMPPAEGFYNLYGQGLNLVYTSEPRHGQTAQFTVLGSDAETRLTGTDYGVSLDLTRRR